MGNRSSGSIVNTKDSSFQASLYEMWSKFSLDKVMEGASRISKSSDSKKELSVRQLELEI
jgi:hypothetical protein